MKPIGIIPFNHDLSATGSTYLRVKGLIDQCDRFEVWRHGVQYDSIILQKKLWEEMARLYTGIKILDICEPDWFKPNLSFMAVASLTDAITCSSSSLANHVKKMFPHKIVEHIPDRLNFKVFPKPKKNHIGIAKKITWFGYINNAVETIPPLLSFIRENKLTLTFIADKPYEFSEQLAGIDYHFIKFSYDNIYQHLKEADIVINPKSNHPLFRFKSNNKSLISWKLGIPVAETVEQLKSLMNPDSRNAESLQQLAEVNQNYNIKDSANQYIEIIAYLGKKKSK